MKELIKVMNQDGELLVSARELHKGLEITERFNSWFNRQLQYGFEENVDFTGCKVFNTLANQELDDYVLKLDMAKEICMLQRSDMGRSFRRYFIDCEKQLRGQQEQLRLETTYSYSNYWIKRELASMKPTDIPEYIDKLLDTTKQYKPTDRLTTYQVARAALEDLQPTLTEPWQREMVQASLNNLYNLIELQKTYINRTRLANKTKKINQLEAQIDLKENKEYYCIDRHSFSCNCQYEYNEQYHRETKTRAYQLWINNLNLIDFLPIEYPNVDFSKNLKIELLFVMKDNMDLDNMIKSIQDQISIFYGFNDLQIVELSCSRLDSCDSYADGKIYVRITNV